MISIRSYTLASYGRKLPGGTTSSSDKQVQELVSFLEQFKLKEVISFRNTIVDQFETYVAGIDKEYETRMTYFIVDWYKSFSSVVFCDEIQVDGDSLDFDRLWKSRYKPLENLDLDSPFGWSFTLSIITRWEPEPTHRKLTENMGLSAEEFSNCSIENNTYFGYCDWNGAVIQLKADHSPNKILFQFILNCIKWDIGERTSQQVMAVRHDFFENIASSYKGGDQVLKLMSDFGYLELVLDKNHVCYDQEDVDMHHLFNKGWGIDDLLARTRTALDDTLKVVDLADNLSSLSAQKNTNVFLNYIAIIGISGTLAGVISTVDFSNILLNTSLTRFLTLFALTIVSLVVFKRITR